jgi:hypothetical protein
MGYYESLSKVIAVVLTPMSTDRMQLLRPFVYKDGEYRGYRWWWRLVIGRPVRANCPGNSI